MPYNSFMLNTNYVPVTDLTTSTLLLSVRALNHTLTEPTHTPREYARAADLADMLDAVIAERAAAGDPTACAYLTGEE